MPQKHELKTNKKNIDVSILATNYNNGKYLADFFNSIINSTVKPKEIIFIDDGSTDNSLEIINKYTEISELKIFKFEKNKGRAAALNFGKEKCTSKYTLFIDPDDILFPERIEIQYNYMQNNPKIDILGGNVSYFNSETGKILNKSNFPLQHSEIYATYYKGENGILQPTAFVRTSILKKYTYEEYFPVEDYDFFAKIIKDGYKFSGLEQVVNKMRIHISSGVSNIRKATFITNFNNRDKIFSTKTSKIKINLYFWHIKYYRKSMFSKNVLSKYFNLFLSILTYPQKIIKRIL